MISTLPHAPAPMLPPPSVLWTSEAGGVRCQVCPHLCLIPSGRVGVCGVRGNDGGRLVNLAYGLVAALGVEPVEKKPLFHYYPGHTTLSLGAAGCNLHCDFCQNWEISQVDSGTAIVGRPLSPEEVIAAALAADCQSLCFTFTEAVVNIEYVLDVARLARAAGLRVLMLTGGYISPAALALLAPWVDAVKFDIKGPDDAFYRKRIGGRLSPVLAALREWRKSAWIEVSTVILPGLNDSIDSLNRMADAILEAAGPQTPWHLMRFFPSFRLAGELPGQMADLRRWRALALERGFHHAYLSNVPGLAEANTYCQRCGELAIYRRAGELADNRLVAGCCPACGAAVAGHGLDTGR